MLDINKELNAAFEASEEIESLLTELKEQVENASQVVCNSLRLALLLL